MVALLSMPFFKILFFPRYPKARSLYNSISKGGFAMSASTRLLVASTCLLLAAASAGAQMEPGGGRDRGAFPQMPFPMTPMQAPVIAVGENALFVFINGTVKKLDKKTLEAQAEKSLDQEDDDKDAFAMLDRNNDGKLDPAEVPLPQEMFTRLDQNQDGVITRDEIPMQLLERFTGRTVRRVMGGQVIVTVDKNDKAVFVYYGGTLFRLDGKTLNIDARLQLGGEGQMPGGDRRGERRGGEQRGGERRRPEERAPGDFQPPAEPVF